MNRRALIAYCLTLPFSYEDYPFDSGAGAGAWAVIRHQSNKKGFAHIFERNGRLCVNLKCEPMRADFLRQVYRDLAPAYHMNKTHWNTVMVGGDVPEEELRRLVVHSYDLVKPGPKKNRTAAHLMDIHAQMLSRYGDPHWWPGETPYEVIAGAVLTQNTAWGNVEKAIANFGGRLSPAYVMGLSHDALAEVIRPAGFFRQKAGYLHTVTRWFARYGCDAKTVRALPQDRIRAELLLLKGVGRETADSILLYAFGFPSFVIDAYTMRLTERLPLPAGQGYEAVKAFFEQSLPCDEALFNRYHALIVLNGKAHCKKKPSCGGCPLLSRCAAGKKAVRQRKN